MLNQIFKSAAKLKSGVIIEKKQSGLVFVKSTHVGFDGLRYVANITFPSSFFCNPFTKEFKFFFQKDTTLALSKRKDKFSNIDYYPNSKSVAVLSTETSKTKAMINTATSDLDQEIPSYEKSCRPIYSSEHEPNLNDFLLFVSDYRGIISGLNFKSEKGLSKIAATDGCKIKVQESPIKKRFNFNVIIPIEVIKTIKSFGWKDYVNLAESETLGRITTFENGFTEHLYFDFIQGKYPDYEKFIPNEKKSVVYFDLDDLIKSVKQACDASVGVGCPVAVFYFNSSILMVKNANGGDCSIEFEFDANKKKKPEEIAFNPYYLLNVLTSLKQSGSSRVSMNINNYMQGVVFKDAPVPVKSTYMLMPIKH